MSIPNLLLLLLTGLVFPAIALGAFRRPGAGVGILLMSLPVLNLARRFFAEPPVPYPSLETFAVLLLWVCVQIVQSRRSLIPVQPHRSQVHVPTIVALTLFLLAGLASSLVAREPILSLKILFTGGVVPILIYSVSQGCAGSWNDTRPIVLGMLGLAFSTGLYAALTFNQRYSYRLGEQLYYSMYNETNAVNLFVVPSVAVATILPALPLAAWCGQFGRRFGHSLVAPAAMAVILVAVLLSLSRGAWFGAGVAILGSLPLYLRRLRWAGLFFLTAAAVLAVTAGGLELARDVVLFRISGPQALRNIDVRQANFLLALQSLPRHVLTGVGLGQYADIYGEFPGALASSLPPLWFAHNLLLTLVSEIGLIGASAFALVLLGSVVTGFRRYMLSGRAGAKCEARSPEVFPQGAGQQCCDRRPGEAQAALGYACAVGILAYLVVASTSGTHLISYLQPEVSATYFAAPALIVVFTLVGLVHNS